MKAVSTVRFRASVLSRGMDRTFVASGGLRGMAQQNLSSYYGSLRSFSTRNSPLEHASRLG